MPRNYDIAELRRLDIAHHLPAQADWQEIEDLGGSRIITHADGCYIHDGDGNRILDGMAGLWCVNVGYGRSELADVAKEQMLELPYYNSFFKTANPPAVMLADKIASLTGGRLPHVFFNSSGSEANDTILRMVRHYWQVKGEPTRTIFISRHNAYHGSTVAGVSMGGMKAMHGQGFPAPGVLPLAGIEHVRQPYWYNEGRDMTPEDFGTACAQAIEDKIIEVGPENVAAFIGEPVQGAGGVIIPPTNYWPQVEAICRKYGILLICDEVICGFGRTGNMWGHETVGVKPDIIAMAKGLSSGYLPISAVAVSADIIKVMKTGGDFVHGYTYSGHPVASAVALRNIEIMEREGLVERTRTETGPYLATALATLNDHPLVGEARSIGLLGAVEIVADKATGARFGGKEGTAGPMVRDHCIANGLMVRGIRDSIVMCPPLIITTPQIDDLVGIIRKSLDEAKPKLRAIGQTNSNHSLPRVLMTISNMPRAATAALLIAALVASPALAAPTPDKPKPPVLTCKTTAADGLTYTVIKAGKGEKPGADAKVKVNYKGMLTTDGSEFDSGRDAEFKVGGVIPGFAQGLQLMQPGGSYRLCIPAALGYGEAGTGPIPPNADLVFEVDLLSFTTPPPKPVVPVAERSCNQITASGLGYLALKTGTGKMPTETDMALVDFTTFDANTGSTLEKRDWEKIPLGQATAIFAEGLKMMQVGSSYTFCLPKAAEAAVQPEINIRVDLLDVRPAPIAD